MKPSSARSYSGTKLGIALGLATLVASPVLGQSKPKEPQVAIISTPAKTQKITDLAARYRFLEHYTAEDDQATAGVVCASRVAIIDVLKETIDSPKGAPRRTESTRHSIFTERPAELNGLGNVNSTWRTYERFRLKPADPMLTGAQPFEGALFLIRNRLADLPQVLNLVLERPFTEYEYDVIAHQMFIPQISLLLPARVVRVGDTWKLTRRAAQALLADPLVVGDGLIGKLIEIRKEVEGPRSVALIEISGKFPTPAGESGVNAQLTFTFVGESSLRVFANKPLLVPRPTEDITEGRGSITEIRLARETTGPLPGPGRLRYQSNRLVTMHRQIGLVEGSTPPPRPKIIPDPSTENTWLTHYDPEYRFSFRHPQDMLLPERNPTMNESDHPPMIRSNREGRDMLEIEFYPKTLNSTELKKLLAEKYNSLKMEVVKGNEIPLPEAEWPKRKVFRIDAEVKLADPKAPASVGSPRIHFDAYLITTDQNSSFVAISSTNKEAVSPFRKEIEAVLKSIALNPPRPLVN